jgi:hypothetical protein
MVAKRKKDWLYYLIKTLIFVVKIPYYIVKYLIKGIVWIVAGIYNLIRRKKVEKFRESKRASYQEFKILENEKGNFKSWENSIAKSDSLIGVIIGARGTGKTAFGMKLLENLHAKTGKKCYSMGFKENELPSWIDNVSSPDEIGKDAFVLIDEGGVLFSSRNSMSNANKLLSQLILISRHKNLSILFISQNSSNLDVNIIRQADFLVLKPSALLQKNFERKIIQKIYEDASKGFEKFKDIKGLTYIYSDKFLGFISNPLPSFWSRGISKSFR